MTIVTNCTLIINTLMIFGGDDVPISMNQNLGTQAQDLPKKSIPSYLVSLSTATPSKSHHGLE